MGQHGVPNNEILLDNVEVHEEFLVGEEGNGFGAAMHGLHLNRPTVAAIAVGAAQCALDYAIAYAKDREAGGRKIVEFQGLRWMMAEDYTQIAAARHLVYDCAMAYDAKLPQEETTKLSSMAKLFAGDTVQRVTANAVQILGGHGYMTDHPVERYMRDAKLIGIYEAPARSSATSSRSASCDDGGRRRPAGRSEGGRVLDHDRGPLWRPPPGGRGCRGGQGRAPRG